MKNICLVSLLAAILITSSIGCNAAKGVGKDVENTGKNIQNIGK